MADCGDHASIQRYGLSHTFARGLRRDLFRMISDRNGRSLPTFDRRRATVGLPYRSARDAAAVFDRMRVSLRESVYGFYDRPGYSSGILLLPTDRQHADGEKEAVLEVRYVALGCKSGRMYCDVHKMAFISHHAVERMFQRLETTSKQDVLSDLATCSVWAMLLQACSSVAASSRRIQQLPLPTEKGILRCVREPETDMVQVRTYIRRGINPLDDASVASLEAWRKEIARSGTNAVRAFDALLNRPENHWWRTPYRGAR